MKMKNRGLNLPDNEKKENPQKNQIRLQVYLAHCGVASRRAAEKIIADGRVTVNGTVETEMGTKVSADDEICVD